MCFILTVLFVIATYVFYSKGLAIQAALSGMIAVTAVAFLIRKLLLNGRCLFGKDNDCNRKEK